MFLNMDGLENEILQEINVQEKLFVFLCDYFGNIDNI